MNEDGSAEAQHLGEEALVWHYYGEEADAAATGRHLDTCAVCRVELERLKATLALVDAWPVPERDAGYGERVWQKLASRERALAAPGSGWSAWWRRWREPRRLALAGTLGAMLAGAFLIGRATHPTAPLSPSAAVTPADARERILAAALSDHLAQSERVLLELVNRADEGEPPAAAESPGVEPALDTDMTVEQQRAASLLDDNRLYRLTAAGQGQRALANVLEDLERVLLDVARGPRDLSPEQLADLRARVDDQQLVFKVRVLEARLRELGSRPPASGDRRTQEI